MYQVRELGQEGALGNSIHTSKTKNLHQMEGELAAVS